MKALEILKTKGKWEEIIKQQIKNNYMTGEPQDSFISQLEDLFEKIDVPEDLDIEIDDFDFNSSSNYPLTYFYVIKKDTNLPILHFKIKLGVEFFYMADEPYYEYYVYIEDLTLKFFDYNTEIKLLPYRDISISSLITEYENFNKILEKVCI